MLKKILLLSLSSMPMVLMTQTASASVKTSSLSISKPSVEQKLPMQCQKMFNVADKLVLDAERQPGTHTQVARMKSKLSATKQEILKMETTMQEKSCNKGLTALNTLKQKH